MSETLKGYHGTSKENAANILKSRKFMPAGSSRDWLGRGVYFFENDPVQAYKFSKAKNRLPPERVCVLGATVEIRENQFIDLTVDEGREFFEQYASLLEEKLKALDKKDGGVWRHKEGYVADFLNEDMPYDFIKAAYRVPKKFQHELFDYEVTQIQICVKDTSCIIADSIIEVDYNACRGLQKKSFGATEKHDG